MTLSDQITIQILQARHLILTCILYYFNCYLQFELLNNSLTQIYRQMLKNVQQSNIETISWIYFSQQLMHILP